MSDFDLERAVREVQPRPSSEPDWNAMVDQIIDAVEPPVVPLFRRPVAIAAALAAAAVVVAALLGPGLSLELSAVEPHADAAPVELPRQPTLSALDDSELAALDDSLERQMTAELAGAIRNADALDWIADDPEPAWADALASLDTLTDVELDALATELDLPE